MKAVYKRLIIKDEEGPRIRMKESAARAGFGGGMEVCQVSLRNPAVAPCTQK